MISISMCMIVKNEQEILARCLDSYAGTYDELIIVDTGSTDNTKEIAAHYTDKIYDFEWINDFSAARNFAFSKAGCDYIFSADADEVLDDTNNYALRELKHVLLPEIDIVQMYYVNASGYNSVYNAHKELRPKLFKGSVHSHGFHQYMKQYGSRQSYMTVTLKFFTCSRATIVKETFQHISKHLKKVSTLKIM